MRTLAAALVASALALGACHHAREDHDNDVVVKMADVPAAVRATIEREARGGKIGEIERETKNGRVVYTADVTEGGNEWDLTVAEDGTFLGREAED